MQRLAQRSQHDRIVFNGHDLGKLVCCKVNRPIMAPVNAAFEAVSGRDGEIFKSVHRSGYDLPVDMWLRSGDRRDVAEIRHMLAEALWVDEPSPLYLPDDPTRYLLAIVSGSTDLGEITDKCPMTTVTFHVCDPDYYGKRHVVDISAGVSSVGAGGNLPAAMFVTAKPGVCTQWTITNVDTGEHVKIAGSFNANTTIRIDMATERVTVNQANAPVSIDSDFFIISGRQRLQVSSGTARLEWRERWL